jgi:hypothetical protein
VVLLPLVAFCFCCCVLCNISDTFLFSAPVEVWYNKESPKDSFGLETAFCMFEKLS